MTHELTKSNDDNLLALVANGDLSKFSPVQRVDYYKARCDAAGLDFRAQPFAYMQLQGKLVLYALKAATDQLTKAHGISVEVLSQVTENDIRTVTVRAKTKDGRSTDEIGCVGVVGLKHENLANAYMKAITKAKRRAVLSLCGLGMNDESEMCDLPGAQPVAMPDLKESNAVVVDTPAAQAPAASTIQTGTATAKPVTPQTAYAKLQNLAKDASAVAGHQAVRELIKQITGKTLAYAKEAQFPQLEAALRGLMQPKAQVAA